MSSPPRLPRLHPSRRARRAPGVFAVLAVLGVGLAAGAARAQPTPATGATGVPGATGTTATPGATIGAATGTAGAKPTTAATGFALAGPSGGGVALNESAASPLVPATRTLPGWQGVWSELDKSSIDLRIALAEIERAEAATRIAWGAALPTLTGFGTLTHIPAGGSGSFSSIPSTGSSLDILQLQLVAAAPLINLRAWHQIGTQRELEAVARLSVADVRRRVGVALARAAVGIASAQRLAELNRIGLAASLERLLLTRKRLAAGVGDARDLVRAEQDVAAARALIPSADESLRQAREGLATVLAIPGDVGIAAEPDVLEREIIAFCGAEAAPTDATTTKRIDVLLAERQIDVAERNVDDIALKFVPTLTGQLSGNATGLAFSGPFATGWTASAVLTVPFYDGGVRYGEMRDRKALVEEARARAVSAQVGALIEIAQARRSIDVAAEAQSSAREARDLAAEADRLARVAYAAGIGTNFDLIDAGRRLREADTQLVLRDLDLARARLALPFVEGRCAGVKTGT